MSSADSIMILAEAQHDLKLMRNGVQNCTSKDTYQYLKEAYKNAHDFARYTVRQTGKNLQFARTVHADCRARFNAKPTPINRDNLDRAYRNVKRCRRDHTSAKKLLRLQMECFRDQSYDHGHRIRAWLITRQLERLN